VEIARLENAGNDIVYGKPCITHDCSILQSTKYSSDHVLFVAIVLESRVDYIHVSRFLRAYDEKNTELYMYKAVVKKVHQVAPEFQPNQVVVDFEEVPGAAIRAVHGNDVVVPLHTRMWANAQRDGRPAEYRWRPLFNAAKFS